ncbi:MAG: MBOAT family protein [Clostridia bacterium]|nr:MBOAT family protein [Clostridia bacterium]
MLFNSLEFLIYFPVVTLLYFIIPHKIRYLWLLVTSYYFYMCWNPRYALLMAASTFFTWLGGAVIDATENKRARKAAVGLNFAVNLLILFFFKYFAFSVDNVNNLLSVFNIAPINVRFDVILPVGISFYTFQALGYTMDVYRGDIKHERNILKYALFVSFFPQLVAGPIERSQNLIHQLSEKHTFSYDRAASGLLLMLWGFFQKLVIADRAAILVDTVYGSPTSFYGFHFAVATVLFAVQIYCDFASYTTIARGAARVLGFELMENFNVPYFARSIADFWSRWHISLTNWFRDYLYIPLGGNRKGIVRKYFNIMLVFFVSGLWHGASWNYIVWGVLHGIMRVIGDLTRNLRKLFCALIGIDTKKPYYPVFQIVLTFILVCIAWIFFRAESLSSALYILRKIFLDFRPWLIFGGGLVEMGLSSADMAVLALAVGVLVFADTLRYKSIGANKMILDMHIIPRFAVILTLLFTTLVFGIYGAGYTSSQFIYFQF